MLKKETFIKVELNKEIGNLYKGTLNSFLINLKISHGKFVLPQTSNKGVYPVYYIVEESNGLYSYGNVIYYDSDTTEMITAYRKSLIQQRGYLDRELSLLPNRNVSRRKLIQTILESIEIELNRTASKEDTLSNFKKVHTSLSFKFSGRLSISEVDYFKKQFEYLLNKLDPSLKIRNLTFN